MNLKKYVSAATYLILAVLVFVNVGYATKHAWSFNSTIDLQAFLVTNLSALLAYLILIALLIVGYIQSSS